MTRRKGRRHVPRIVSRIVVALLVVSCVVGARAEPLSPAQFTTTFATALRTELPTTTITVIGELQLTVKAADGKEARAFLDNAYREYLADPSNDLASVMRKFVGAFAEQQRLSSAKLDRAQIVPVIKDRQWLSQAQAAVKARGVAPPQYVAEPFNDELVVFYVEDTPKNIRYLIPKQLEEGGVARTELRTLAIQNLKRLLPRIEVHGGPLVSMITAGGSYESSLLLFDDLWSKGDVPARVDGDVVVALPARDLLFFTGSRNSAGVARLRELAAKYVKQASYTLTDALFVYRSGRFVRFDGR